MKKLFILIFLLASISLQAQNVPDLIRTTPVPATGANKNNRATVDANLKAGLSFLPPKGNAYSLNGAKDSAGYLYFNDILKRLGVYRGAGIWDNPLNVVTTSYQNLNINDQVQVITDATSNFGKSLYLPQGSIDPGVRPIYGPYLGLENGEYTYKFYLKINTNLTDTARFLHVDIAENGNSIMSTYIRYSDFMGANVWTPFRIVFNGVKGRNYECRIDVVHGGDPYPAQYPTKTNLWYDYGQIIGIREFVPTDLSVYATQTDLTNGLNSLTSTNGLTKTGSNTQLGGNFIHPTYLNAFTYVFGLHGANSRYSYDFSSTASEGEEGPDKSSIILGANDNQTNTASSLNIRSDGFALKYSITGNTNFVISSDGTITDNIRNKGLFYSNNYFSAGSQDNRWIPDWGSVKGLLPAGGVADDALVLHKFGAETARGDKTLKDMLTIQKNILFQDTVSNNAWYLDIENPASGGNGLTISKTGQPYFQFLDHGVLIRSSNGYVRDTVLFKSDIVGKIDSATIANKFKRYQTNGFTVYNSGYWSNLSDFTTNGFTPTITATNTIQFTGGTADTTKYITVNGAVNTDENINFEVIYVPATTTGYGLRIGKRSVNTPVPNSGSIGYDVQNNTLNIYGSLGDNLLSTITNSFKVAAGDLLSLKYVQRGSTITATLTDITQNYASLTLVNSNVNINSSAMVVYNWGNTNDIRQIKITSNSNRSPKLIVQGDSKQVTPTYYQKYANYLGSLGIIDIFAGIGDRTADVLADLPYIIKYVKPEYVVLNIGRNDLYYGTPTATWQANYASIVSQYTAAGIKVVNLLPIPETVVADQSILYNYITANYTQRIDVAPVWSNALDLFTDNVHPNEAGARLIANTILASNLIPKNPNLQVDQITDVQSYSAKVNSQNTFTQNQQIFGLELGTRSSFISSSNGGIYTTQTGGAANFPANNGIVIQSRGNSNADIYQVTGATPSIKTRLYGATGNFQIGGAASTDAGYTLDVQGTQRVTGNTLFNGIFNWGITAGNNVWQTTGNGAIWVSASGGTVPFNANGNLAYQSRVSAGFGHYFGTGATPATRFAILDASNISYNNFTPDATNTRTLGTSTLLWSNAYLTNYQVSLTGLLKGNGAGANVTAAAANTDYLPVNNAALTGTPTVPTPATNVNTTQAINGAFANTYYTPLTRTITTTLPLTGGGDLSANRTFGIGGLTAYGTANQVLGMNAAATGYEYKTITAGTNVSVTQGVNSITIAATGNPIVEISGTTQAAAANTIYIPHNAALTSITMPTTTVIGSLYQVIGEGAGGWKLILPTGAVAVGVGGFTTTSGGSLSSTDRYCTITIRLIATNKFSVTTSQGTITPL